MQQKRCMNISRTFQPQDVAGTQRKNFICVGGKPGLSELSSGRLDFIPWEHPAPHTALSQPPVGLREPTLALRHYLCCSP